ncbi:hypothetical protein [Haloarchaeobius amylolyticus]|uniref:hypothetical protein n=1 Tax=Haloarchaeobius amylolyticus TaxID=1198296 RepID=UPI00226E1C3C|nr:hypothetical protein [Haloarchaeobius amylolyticus]
MLLGASAVLDIVARLPEDLIAPLLSITGGLFGGTSVSFLTTWVMFGVAFYTFGHLPYRYLHVRPRDDPLFRVLYAVGAVILGIGLQVIEAAGTLVSIILPGTVIGGGSLLLFLMVAHDWRPLNPDGRVVDVLAVFALETKEEVRDEITSDLAYDGLLGYTATTFYLLAVMFVLGIPMFLGALGVQTLVYAFPVPDVLFLAWASAVRFIPESTLRKDRDRLLELDFDIERFLISTVRNATRGTQGAFSTMYCFMGLFLTAGYLLVAVNLTPAVSGMIGTALGASTGALSLDAMVIIWDWIGVLVLLFFAGCHGLWVWLREVQRLPYFLETWEGRAVPAVSRPAPRVRGFVAFPILALLSSATFVTFLDSTRWVFAIVWPAIVIGGLVSVKYTLQEPLQQVGDENLWITSGLILQMVTLWSATELKSLIRAVVGEGGLLDMVGLPVTVTVLLLVVASIPHIERYEQRFDDIRRYSLVFLLVTIGAASSVATWFVPESYRIFSVSFSIIGLGAGGLLGFARYHDL